MPDCWHSQGNKVPASRFSLLCHLLFFVKSDLRSFQQLHLLQCFQLAMLLGQGGSTSAPAVMRGWFAVSIASTWAQCRRRGPAGASGKHLPGSISEFQHDASCGCRCTLPRRPVLRLRCCAPAAQADSSPLFLHMLDCWTTLYSEEHFCCGVAAVRKGLCFMLGTPSVAVEVFSLLLAGMLCSPGQRFMGCGSALPLWPSGLEASGCPASGIPGIVTDTVGGINAYAASPAMPAVPACTQSQQSAWSGHNQGQAQLKLASSA